MAKHSGISSGDCLVIARPDGLFQVFKVWAGGARQPVNREITDLRTAWQVAHALLDPDGGVVYYKNAEEPDSAIRPYQAHEQQARLAFAPVGDEVAV